MQTTDDILTLVRLSIEQMVQRFAVKGGDLYEIICERIAQSPVVGGDETEIRGIN